MQSMASQQWPTDRDKFQRAVCATALLVFLLGLFWAAAGCARPPAHTDRLDHGRRNEDSELIPQPVPDRFYNDLFTRRNGGWTGGDGTRSVALPDGRILWLFGDTFLGTIRPERSRPQAAQPPAVSPATRSSTTSSTRAPGSRCRWRASRARQAEMRNSERRSKPEAQGGQRGAPVRSGRRS